MPETDNTSSATPSATASTKNPTEITPQLVREVAEKVYAMWRRDLILAHERTRDNDMQAPTARTRSW